MKTTHAQASKYFAMLTLLLICNLTNLFAGSVLVYGPLLSFYEDTIATSLGHTVTIVDTSQWKNMTTAQFAAYDAIIIPENGFASNNTGNTDPFVMVLNNTKAVWSPAITGARVYISYDPLLDGGTVGFDRVISGIDTVATSGGTGLYFATGLLFFYSPPTPVVIDFLSMVDSIRVKGGTCLEATFTYYPPEFIKTDSCYDTTPLKIVATPFFNILNLTSNYFCSGNTFDINFHSNLTSYLAGNVFTVQLSDATGSFASPVNIGSVTSTNIVSIPVTIPNGTSPGSGYLIRIVSSSPSDTSNISKTNLNININRDWYLDADNDHYYTGNLINQCDSPGVGFTTTGILGGNDCDDNDPQLHDGNRVWYLDADNDHYYIGSGITQCHSPGVGYIFEGFLGGNDCNDNNAAINPSMIEVIGNGIDDNCNGILDENNAMKFDGANDSIVAPYFPNQSLNPVNNYTLQTIGLTLSAWIKLDAGSMTQKIISRTSSYSLEINNANQLQYRSGGYDANDPARFGQIPIGVWTHVAVAVENTSYSRNITFYINGQIVGSSTSVYQAYITTYASDLNIGANFHGKIDELTIWNGARTQAQIQSDMCGVACPNADLIAHYSFNQGIANGNNLGIITAIDNSGSNNHGTLRNFALTGSSSNWSDSYQLYEDLDNDGYGSANIVTCGVSNNTDCDDNDAAVHDGTVVWYLDADGDHYYIGSPISSCHSPGAGYTNSGILGGDDCNDSEPTAHDGTIMWYMDGDGDHYVVGDPIQSCLSPGVGYIFTGILGYGDCDDADTSALYPYQSWVLDADGDNFYVTEVFQCYSPGPGYVKRFGNYYPNDCDDNNPFINPGAIEIPGNGIDENCNGVIDETLPCYPNIVNQNNNYCISNVIIGTINNQTSCEATHYGVYTNLSTTANPGSTQTIYLASSGSTSHFSIYVDWNDNFILGDDPSELVLDNITVQPPYFGGTTTTFTIPTNAVFGNHIMRIISEFSGYNISNPCYTSYGEVEDYTLNVGNCTPYVDNICQGNSYINNVTIGTLSNNTNCDGVSDYSSTLAVEAIPGTTLNYSISLNGYYGADAGISIYIDYNNDGDFNDVDEQISNFEYASAYINDATGSFLIPSTLPYGNYRIRIVSDSYWIGSSDPCHSTNGEIEDYTLYVVPIIYCQPIITYSCNYDWITNVTIGTINNTSICTGSYTDYSFSNSVAAQAGEPLNFSVAYGGSSSSTEDIYIDFNQDGDFDDVGEQVVTDAYADYMTPATGTFSIPGNTPSGNYRIRVRSGNDFSLGACDNSDFGEVEDYGLTVTAIDVCAPVVDVACNDLWISHVILGSIDNSSNCYGGYSNYASTLSTSTGIYDPLNYYIEVNGYSSQQVNIFIDFNNDGDFDDADENVVMNAFANQTYNSPSGNLYLPYWVTAGNYRVRVTTDTYSSLVDPCHIDDGEVEDYMLNIHFPTWYHDFDGDNYGDPSVFVYSEFNPPGYVANSSDCDDHNANVYPGAVEIPGNMIDENCNGFVDELYCIPTGTENHCTYMWINRVVIGSIDNTTGCTTVGYSDFSSTQSTSQLPNANVNFDIYGYGNDQKVNIYIDYNSDFDFDDAGEEVATEVYMQNNGVPASGSFTIPSSLATGNYRVRVISEYNLNNGPTSCSTYFGETEDYTLTIVSTCTDPSVPTISSTSTSNCGAQSTVLSISAGILNDATDWKWYSGSCGGTLVGTGTSITVSPATTTTYFVRGEGGCVSNGVCGTVTINVASPQTWYEDIDGDGYGNSAVSLTDCALHPGYVTVGGDCGDMNGSVHPGAVEVCGNGIDDNCNGQIDEGCSLLVNMKVFIQGYYLAGGMMIAVIDPVSSPTICDTLVLQLANSNSPYQIQYADTALLNTDGSVQFEFPTNSAGNHYFVLRHRNAVETWSANPQSISSGMFYDFTDASNKSFGNNVIDLGNGNYGLFSGDISNNLNQKTQDGIIDNFDFLQMESSIPFLLSGYQIEDLTGDNLIESSDYSLLENNLQLNISVKRP